MKAVVMRSFGSADVLETADVPVPEPARDEIVVRVRAFSINPVDYKMRSGAFPGLKAEQLPVVLGRDAAGSVARTGDEVAGFAEGDRVFGLTSLRRGSYAECTLLKESALARLPDSLDWRSAAAAPLAALTAWQGLFDHGFLEAGQHVLIHGGGGGVGHFAVQLAKDRGARVSTTASGADVELLRGLGADDVIDYRSERFEDRVRDVDLVLDLVGGETQERSWSVLRQNGVLVSTLNAPSKEKAAALGARAENYFTQADSGELEEIARLLDAGRLRPNVDAVYPFDLVGDAQGRLEHEHVRGKVVVEIGD